MTGVITSLPPLVEQPPGSNSSNPAGLPGVTYTAAIPTLPQTWTALQTFQPATIALAGTGGSSQVLKQTTVNGVVTVGQLSFADISGSIGPVQIPAPTPTSLGGVNSLAAASHQFLTQIGTDGSITAAQPAFTDISGSVAATQMPALTGDATTSAGAVATTLATVNANVGSFGSATQSVQFTVNGKGLMTAAANVTVTPAVASITGLATGVATFLATPSSANLRAALTDEVGTGAAYFVGGALGTPASGTATNLTGLPLAGLATQAANTIVGNLTGSTASPTAFTIDGLTLKGTPASTDEVIIWDVAGSAIKKATVSGIGSSSGVSSIAGNTGAFTLSQPITNATNAIVLNASIHPQGRLTLQTLVPVMITTQSAKTTLYYTPYQGNLVPIYDGTNMIPTAFSELSVLTTDATKSPAAIGVSKVNDWFVWNDAGTIRLGHGPDWTSDTARSAGTALTMVNGILLNNASITNGPAASRGTYVGTTRSDGSSQLNWILGANNTAGNLAVWNAYNRRAIKTAISDTTATWTYASTTPRQKRGSANNQISFVSGLQEDWISVVNTSMFNLLSATTAFADLGVALDSTSVFDKSVEPNRTSQTGTITNAITVTNTYAPQLGYHFVAPLEAGDGTNTTTFIGGATRDTFWMELQM